MIIAGAALNQLPMDWKGNRSNILTAITEAQEAQVELLCLPELCITGYGCEDLFLSEWLYQKALEVLLSIREHTQNIAVAIGLPILHEGRRYNCTCLVSNGEILGFYAKRHLAKDGVHYEPRWFESWTAGISEITVEGKSYPFGNIAIDLNGQHIGFEICEDAWQEPRTLEEHSHVDIVLNPSASHFAFGKSRQREDLVLKASKRWNCTYIYANLLGDEAGRMIYDGEVLVARNGEFLAQNQLLSFLDANLMVVDLEEAHGIDLEVLPKEEEFPRAVALGLFDYMRKSWSKGFTLSLSGGADSSACAVLVAEMVRRGVEELGIEHFCEKLHLNKPYTSEKEIVHDILFTAYQGTKNSSDDTFNSAKDLADSIGATFYHWLIDDEVHGYTDKLENALGRKLAWETDDIALQNIQARSRSPIIWMLTNVTDTLLLTTSNRSEGDVGYATMDGDTSGSLAPISAVDKHFIRQWLRYAESELGYDGLQRVNSMAPTAELRPSDQHQTDEDDLMPYDLMVAIERLAFIERLSPKATFETLKADWNFTDEQLKGYVKKFYRLWSRNQWKRERLAPAFHLDEMNVDPRTWLRFPILSSGFKEELEQL